jgi:chromosome segregation ATPase
MSATRTSYSLVGASVSLCGSHQQDFNTLMDQEIQQRLLLSAIFTRTVRERLGVGSSEPLIVRMRFLNKNVIRILSSDQEHDIQLDALGDPSLKDFNDNLIAKTQAIYAKCRSEHQPSLSCSHAITTPPRDDDLREQFQNLRCTIDSLKGQLEQLLAQQGKIDDLNKQIGTERAAVRDQDKRELDSAQERLKGLEDQLRQAEAEKKELQEKMGQLEQQRLHDQPLKDTLASKKQKIANLRAQLKTDGTEAAQRDATIKQLEAKLSELEKARTQSQKDLADKDAAIRAVNQKVTDKEQLIDQLEKQNGSLSAQNQKLAAAQQDADAVRKQLRELQQEREESVLRNQQLEDDKKELQERIGALNKNLADKDAAARTVNQKVTDREQLIDQLEKRNGSLSAQNQKLAAAQQDAHAARKQLRELQQEREESVLRNQQLEDDKKKLQERIGALTDELAQKKGLNKQLQNNVIQLQTANEDLKNRIVQLEKENARLPALEKELEALKRELSVAEDTNKDLENRVKDLDGLQHRLKTAFGIAEESVSAEDLLGKIAELRSIENALKAVDAARNKKERSKILRKILEALKHPLTEGEKTKTQRKVETRGVEEWYRKAKEEINQDNSLSKEGKREELSALKKEKKAKLELENQQIVRQ